MTVPEGSGHGNGDVGVSTIHGLGLTFGSVETPRPSTFAEALGEGLLLNGCDSEDGGSEEEEAGEVHQTISVYAD